MSPNQYDNFIQQLSHYVKTEQVITNPLLCLAYGTDASFYRLIPKVVIRVHNESEVVHALRLASKLAIPITFRAAGTSLSGQAISDSVLLIATHNWRKHEVLEKGEKIRLQPGIIGSHANAILAPYGKKIGPDPASIAAAMIGGIAANNASGMCCGTAQNSYQTIADIRIVLHDGTILDTALPENCDTFKKTHSALVEEIIALRDEISGNSYLTERIKTKYKIKNTTGYSLNAFVDHSDPIEIIKHLMIGSEGTLAFISDITYHTVVDEKYKSCTLMIFETINQACNAIPLLKESPVSAVELLDRKSIRSVENDNEAPEYFKTLIESATILLVDCRANTSEELVSKQEAIRKAVAPIPIIAPFDFTSDSKEYNFNWKARKGLLATVGGLRPTGTTCLLEDVAFPIHELADGCTAIQKLFTQYCYDDAVLFGHALEGNLHLVFSQNFEEKEDIQRYADMMDELVDIVVKQFNGSLKAEHGTGRNMAPFVEREWGEAAYTIMKRVKQLFDPNSLINPGVIINDNPHAHIENIKALPATHEVIDQCMECGFCEPHCVSHEFTLSPRQRIAVEREIVSLKRSNENPAHLLNFIKDARFYVQESCAADGLCQQGCPVNINTGEFVKALRQEEVSSRAKKVAVHVGRHMSSVTSMTRMVFNSAHVARSVMGDSAMKTLSKGIHKITLKKVPQWMESLPKGAAKVCAKIVNAGRNHRVVYFPSCSVRTFGVSPKADKSEIALAQKTEELLIRAGFTIIYPSQLNNLCCGMAFKNRGFIETGLEKSRELEVALLEASEQGEYPILFDTSPCAEHFKKYCKEYNSPLKLFEPVIFMLKQVMPKLTVKQKKNSVMIFPVCSVKKSGVEPSLLALSQLCAENVQVVQSNCCGFAGDKGLLLPELNKHGLKNVNVQIPDACCEGYSTSRTCEIGLSQNTAIDFKSIFYLIEEVTR